MNGSRVLVLGVAYKQDIDDYRESPALKVIENFQKEGSQVVYYDPYIPTYKFKGQKFESLKELSREELINADVIVITTAHSNFDYDFIQQHAKAIFDTKNAMKNAMNRENIVLL